MFYTGLLCVTCSLVALVFHHRLHLQRRLDISHKTMFGWLASVSAMPTLAVGYYCASQTVNADGVCDAESAVMPLIVNLSLIVVHIFLGVSPKLQLLRDPFASLTGVLALAVSTYLW